jgi:hypothetical protein
MRKSLSYSPQQPRQVAVGLTVLLTLELSTLAGPALGAPTLWGYGVKSCKEYLAVSAGNGSPASVAGKEYGRYREWLAGLVTGLNLATGTDVLGGAELDAALTRIGAHCRNKPADDFFNASMSLIRSLGQVKGTGGKVKKE